MLPKLRRHDLEPHRPHAGSGNAEIVLQVTAYPALFERVRGNPAQQAAQPGVSGIVELRMVNVRPAGEHLVEQVFHAGGIPAVMKSIETLLHTDALTVSGDTIWFSDPLKKPVKASLTI